MSESKSKQTTSQVSPVRSHYTRPAEGRPSTYTAEQAAELLQLIESANTIAEEVTLTIADRGTHGHEVHARGMDASHVTLYDSLLKVQDADTWGAEGKTTKVAFRTPELRQVLDTLLKAKTPAVRLRLSDPPLGSAEAEKEAAAAAAADKVKTADEHEKAQAAYDAASEAARQAREAVNEYKTSIDMLEPVVEGVPAGQLPAGAQKELDRLNEHYEQAASENDQCEEDRLAAEGVLDTARAAAEAAAGRQLATPTRLELAGELETHKIRAIEGAATDTPLPRIPYTHGIELAAPAGFLKTLQRLQAVNEYVTISVAPETSTIVLESTGESGSLRLDYIDCTVHVIDSTAPDMQVTFDSKLLTVWLQAILKGAPGKLVKSVAMLGSTSKPVLIQVKTEHAKHDYYAAPRVEN